jgi:hypothetical protein
MSNIHLNYLCNIAANNHGKIKKMIFLLKTVNLDGTSPSPMLFTTTNSPRSDISSRHQQIIDAFLNDGKTEICI